MIIKANFDNSILCKSGNPIYDNRYSCVMNENRRTLQPLLVLFAITSTVEIHRLR